MSEITRHWNFQCDRRAGDAADDHGDVTDEEAEKKVGERILIDLRNPPKSSGVGGRPIRLRCELQWSNF
jgi:hypothetical protein